MDIQLLKTIEARLKEVELKVEAISNAIDLEYQYQPEKYTLVKPGEEKGDN